MAASDSNSSTNHQTPPISHLLDKQQPPVNAVPEGTKGPYIARDPSSGYLVDLSLDPVSGRPRRRRIPLAYDENGWPIWAYNEGGTPVCGKKLGNVKGQICMDTKRCRTGRCQKHGGKMPRGVENASYRHGAYSKALPVGLREMFEGVAEDPTYLELKQNIAIIDLQILENMKKFEKDLDAKTWEKLMKLTEDAKAALQTAHLHPNKEKALDQLRNLLSKMIVLIETGSKDSRIWNEIAEASKTRAQLVKVETARLQAERNAISADTAYTLFAQLLDIVKRNVRDKAVLAAIASEVDRLAIGAVNRQVMGGHIDTASMSVQSGLGTRVDPERANSIEVTPAANNPLVPTSLEDLEDDDVYLDDEDDEGSDGADEASEGSETDEEADEE